MRLCRCLKIRQSIQGPKPPHKSFSMPLCRRLTPEVERTLSQHNPAIASSVTTRLPTHFILQEKHSGSILYRDFAI